MDLTTITTTHPDDFMSQFLCEPDDHLIGQAISNVKSLNTGVADQIDKPDIYDTLAFYRYGHEYLQHASVKTLQSEYDVWQDVLSVDKEKHCLRAKECYRNVFMYALHADLDEPIYASIGYIVDFQVFGMPVLHAWVYLPERDVHLDPTMELARRRALRDAGIDDHGLSECVHLELLRTTVDGMFNIVDMPWTDRAIMLQFCKHWAHKGAYENLSAWKDARPYAGIACPAIAEGRGLDVNEFIQKTHHHDAFQGSNMDGYFQTE
jgi:hypothetical protein